MTRSGGYHSQIQLRDLSDELFLIVFQHADFFTQQKLCRISRRWKYVLQIPEVSRNVNLNTTDLASIFNWEQYMAGQPLMPEPDQDISEIVQLDFMERVRFHATVNHWRKVLQDKSWPDIVQITFNGLHRARCSGLNSRLLETLIEHCPNFRHLHLRNVHLDMYDTRFKGPFCYNPENTLTLTNSRWFSWSEPNVPGAFCDNPPVIPGRKVTTSDGTLWRSISAAFSYDIPALSACPPYSIEWRIEALLWPYPNEQLDWLVDSAVRLANNEAWLRWLTGVMLPKFYDADAILENTLFPDMFRDGEEAGIRELLERSGGKLLIALAAYIRVWANEIVAPPPCRFEFEDAITAVPLVPYTECGTIFWESCERKM